MRVIDIIASKTKLDTSYFKRKRINQLDGTNSYYKQMIDQNSITKEELISIQDRIEKVLKANINT